MNRFKGLDQVDRVPEDLQTEVLNILQETVTKSIPKKMKCKKAKWCLRRLHKQLKKEMKGKEERGNHNQGKCRDSENSKKR